MNISKKGFSLIELIIVIAVIGILAGVTIVGVKAARARSRDARRITDLNRVDAAITQYYNVEKSYPENSATPSNYVANFDNLKNISAFFPKYISPLPSDPGSNQYKYYTDGVNFALWGKMEESNYRFANNKEDGGPSDEYYELGTGDSWTSLIPGGE